MRIYNKSVHGTVPQFLGNRYMPVRVTLFNTEFSRRIGVFPIMINQTQKSGGEDRLHDVPSHEERGVFRKGKNAVVHLDAKIEPAEGFTEITAVFTADETTIQNGVHAYGHDNGDQKTDGLI